MSSKNTVENQLNLTLDNKGKGRGISFCYEYYHSNYRKSLGRVRLLIYKKKGQK